MAELLLADPATDRDHWLELRRGGVTATDIGVVLGLVSWDSPWALWHRKRGLLPEVEETDRMRLGSWLEDAIKRRWWESTPRAGDVFGNELWGSSERPWQLATLDGWVSGYDRPGVPVAVLECKTSTTRDGWGANEAPGFHDPSGFQVPAHVRAQVLWQMDVLGVPTGHVAVVFLPSGEFRSYTISHEVLETGTHLRESCRACEDVRLMQRAGLEFYRRMRGELPPPPLDGSQATLDGLKHLHAGRVKGKEAGISLQLEELFVDACEAYDVAKENKAEAANLLRDAMGDAHYAVSLFDGVRFARRDVFKKAAYEVAAHEEDRLVRVKPKETGDG